MATRPLSPKPDTEIDFDDFLSKAIDEQCVVSKEDKQVFVGEPGTRTGLGYPHVHVWRNGTIALSFAKGVNEKIGADGVINITKLAEATARRELVGSRLRNTIGWILASAS